MLEQSEASQGGEEIGIILLPTSRFFGPILSGLQNDEIIKYKSKK
jgi:hypothetical protein